MPTRLRARHEPQNSVSAQNRKRTTAIGYGLGALSTRPGSSVSALSGWWGCELIDYYAKKAGKEPFTTHILKTYPDLNIKQLRKIQRQFWTAFKHATHQGSGIERDDNELLTRFSDEQNDHALFIGWYDYALSTKTMPIEAQVHQAWYLALYHEKLDPKHSIETYEELFPALRTKTRIDQKRALNQKIKRARKDTAIMADPRTDKRPLKLNAPKAVHGSVGCCVAPPRVLNRSSLVGSGLF